MPDEFTHEVFLSHSAKEKAVVRAVAERLRADGLRVWFDEWVLKAGDSIPAKIEEGLESSRVLVLCISANAFGSDWAQLEASTFRFRDPMNKKRRFIPLRLDNAPIKGSLAQFLYINWLSEDSEQEYAKLLEACSTQSKQLVATTAPTDARPSNQTELVRIPHAGTGITNEHSELKIQPAIGDAWSGIRAVLHSYSTKDIKEILGKACLPISGIEYSGTHKGPFLDEVDRMLRGLYRDERDRGVVGCIQEIIAFERNKAERRLACGAEPDDQILRELQRFWLGSDTT